MATRQDEAERGRFAILLRQLRESRGLTQDELARRSGVSVRAIQDLESGRRRTPQFQTVNCLIKALSTTDSERDALTAAARSRPNSELLPDKPPGVADHGFPASTSEQPATKRDRRRQAALIVVAAIAVSAVVLSLVLPAFRSQPDAAVPPPKPTPSLARILSPTNGATIPGDVRVHGTASLPTGTELWLLLQPQHGDPRYIGTTPEPIKVDASGAWTARIRVGRGPRDGGYRFRLVAVVSPMDGCVQRHVKLLPKGEHYPKMAEIPEDCLTADEIVVTRAK